MKRLIHLAPLLLLCHSLFSQTKLVPFNTCYERVAADSVHVIRTSFRDSNLDFLRGSSSDSSYLKSPLYNLPCFNSNSAKLLLADLRRKKREI